MPEPIPTEPAATADSPPAEAAPVVPPPAELPKPEVASSNRFAALRRQERKLREKAAEVAKAEIAAKLARDEVEATKAKLSKGREDPLEALAALGLTYEQVTDAILAKGKDHVPTPVDASVKVLRAELEELKAARDADRKAREEAEASSQAARQAQTLEAYWAGVKKDVQAQTDAFELVNLADAHPLVYQTIQAHYDSTGEVLPTAEAAKQVEELLEKQFREVLAKSKKLGTMQTTHAPVSPTEAPKPAPTLSAALTSTKPPSEGEMSDAARVRRAVEALKALRK